MRVIFLVFIKSMVVMSFAILGLNAGMFITAFIPRCGVYLVCTIVSVGFALCGLIVAKGVK